MKWIGLLLLIALQCACETTAPPAMSDQYNRRDLYSPEPEPDSPEAARQMRTRSAPTPIEKPQFRG